MQQKGGKAPIAVNFVVLKESAFEDTLFVAGKTGAFNQVELLPEISAKVTAIYFTEGQKVEKGELLVKLNDADLQSQLMKNQTKMKLSHQ